MKLLDIFKRKSTAAAVEQMALNESPKIAWTKEEFRYRKKIIDDWVEEYSSRTQQEEKERVTIKNIEIESKNSLCPKCNTNTKTVNKFIKKGTKVFKYNHCNNCGHEWEHTDLLDPCVDKYCLGRAVPHVLDHVVLDLWNNSYDPHDITCEFDSAEEEEQYYINKLINSHYGKFIRDIPLEVLYYFGYRYGYSSCHMVEEIFGEDITYGFENTFRMYTGRFTKKMEDILVNKLGVTKLFNN